MPRTYVNQCLPDSRHTHSIAQESAAQHSTAQRITANHSISQQITANHSKRYHDTPYDSKAHDTASKTNDDAQTLSDPRVRGKTELARWCRCIISTNLEKSLRKLQSALDSLPAASACSASLSRIPQHRTTLWARSPGICLFPGDFRRFRTSVDTNVAKCRKRVVRLFRTVLSRKKAWRGYWWCCRKTCFSSSSSLFILLLIDIYVG